MFALVSRGDRIDGLDAAGPAPARADPSARVATTGPESVTVPGVVAGWSELADRHGSLGLDVCLRPAIDIAESGFALGARAARMWSEASGLPRELAPPPPRGAIVRFRELAATLRRIAEEGPTALYEGAIAAAISRATWLDESDLVGYQPRWVEPLSLTYNGTEVVEMPPPTQGVAALIGLGILAELGPGLLNQVVATRLALDDALLHVRDGANVQWLIEQPRLRERSAQGAQGAVDLAGGTAYLCVVDADRMAVSLIESIFEHFGSGIVVPGTGIVMNNRAACFGVNGAVVPGARPYHTIIPGLLRRNGKLLGPFGIMGGFIQAQAHVQFVSAVVDDGLDPQAALDRPRFRLGGNQVALEGGLWDRADDIRKLGLEPIPGKEVTPFGGGQAIFIDGASLIGGSDPRKDGYAAGY
jgi:gamma-glutamyltranspeptidase/glutathione hydrolase